MHGKKAAQEQDADARRQPSNVVRFSREAPRAQSRDRLEIDGRSVTISHPRRVYYPDEKLSKRNVVDFYRRIAPWLLPWLKDRPIVLHRYPQGIHHEDFYQKDNPQEKPDWVQTVPVQHHHNDEPTDYLLCQNEATLVYMVNLGSLEMNPWSSRVPALDFPDWMIFDLDPVEIDFRKVVEVARIFHTIFDGAGIPHYCKTSGKRGLHLAVPLGAQYDNETVKDMALAVAKLVHRELPSITSLERSPSRRRGKVYLDYLQNGFGKTLASPYSLRPIAWAGVSTPLHWDEVQAGLDPQNFNCHTIFDRLERYGDIWEPVLTEAIDLGELLGA